MNATAPALIYGAECWSVAALRTRAQHRADFLTAQGLRAGQVVLAPDAPAFDLILLQHALATLGAALLPYRANATPAQIAQLVATTGAEWRWFPESNQLVETGCNTVLATKTALALLITTSGSSGTPKVVMLTRDNLLASAQAVNARLGLQAGDCWLVCLRLCHIGGISISYRTALAGATLLLHDGFDAAKVLADLQCQPVTHLSVVPPMLARLLDLDSTPPPALRVLLVGGQAISPALLQRALAASWPVYLSYGMTETASQIAVTNPPRPPFSKGGSKKSPPLEKGGWGDLSKSGWDLSTGLKLSAGVELIAPDCIAPAQRLRIRGAMVMTGYATPQRQPGIGLVNGWFETADLGCLNAEGQLHLHGRADDVCVIGGNNVSLARVETVINAAPGVVEAVIVVLDDSIWGHRLIAVYRGESDAAAVQRWCQTQLSGAEQPRQVLRMRRLPLLASGKYDRQRLTAIVHRLLRDLTRRS
ncbi:AMP-binding protein [Chromatium okenii]|uniref:AMP-binding protein n=1 Tax=Chromatium okenii TaxID=61644 RepID=UPI0026E94A0D|nr:AMP-binding protein [Chromatium okenii]